MDIQKRRRWYTVWLGMSLVLLPVSVGLVVLSPRKLLPWLLLLSTASNVVVFRQLLKDASHNSS